MSIHISVGPLFVWYTLLILMFSRHTFTQDNRRNTTNFPTQPTAPFTSESCSNSSYFQGCPSNCTQLCRGDDTKDKKVLYFLAVAPYPLLNEDVGAEPSWKGGPEVIPGAQLAVFHINCNPTILPNFTIKLVIADGGCNLSVKAATHFTSNVFYSVGRQGNIVGVIGGGCSESSFVIGSLSGRKKISLLQIAPSATSPLFVSEAYKYPNTFRPTVSALAFIKVFKRIILDQKYKEVAILYEAERPFMVTVSDNFRQALDDAEVSVNKTFGLYQSYLEPPLQEIENRVRVIFVFAGLNYSLQVLCVAYQRKMLYPDYQFIFINRRAENFNINVTITFDKTTLYTCSDDEMREALPSVTFFQPRVIRIDKKTCTRSGYTFEEIECQYHNALTEHKQSLGIKENVSTDYENAYYDSTWALAQTLHNAQDRGVDLASYTYGQPNITKIIRDELFKLSFEGVTGKVQFSNTTFDGSDVSIVDIFQQKNGTNSNRVAYYDPVLKKLTRNKSNNFKLLSSSVFDRTFVHPPRELGYTMIVLSILVGLVIVVLHFLNEIWGDLKTVKATSPQLNHLIFSGCYLTLMAVIVYSIDASIIVESEQYIFYGVLCNTQVWLASLSFSLVFGTICMKTWRIFRIFTHFSSNPIKYVNDFVLVGFVVFLVVLDGIFLTIWNAVDPLIMHVERQAVVFRAICSCNDLGWWLGFLLSYKVLLIVAVVYLSIVTRKVDKREFKQTKSINTLVYILVFVTILGIVPHSIVTASETTKYGPIIGVYVVFCAGYILTAIMCAVFVFLPPIYPVLKKKWRSYRRK